jgi:hypothetical protein
VSRPRLVAVLALALASGCRLSAPAYAFRALHAEEPAQAGNSLLFGSLEITATFGSIDTIQLHRVSPSAPGELYPTATERIGYRVFRPRAMKDGHFLVEVPPGVYEITALQGGLWGRDALFVAGPDARRGSRVVVAQPGVYDLGVIRLDAGAFARKSTVHFAGTGGPERKEILRNAIAGTEWTRFVPPAR